MDYSYLVSLHIALSVHQTIIISQELLILCQILAKLIGEMGIYSREERRIITNKRKQGGKWRTQV
jgi:hypothetical protein